MSSCIIESSRERYMSETLAAIVSVLVPTIGIQIGIMFFIFRRMDRLEERITQRMDRADEDRDNMRAEFRQANEATRNELRLANEATRNELRQDNETTRNESRESFQSIREELAEVRTTMTSMQSDIARLEGAVDVLRGLVERFVTTARQPTR